MFLTILQVTNPFLEFLGILDYFNLAGWKIPIMGLIILAGIIVVIIIIYKILFLQST